MASLGHIAVGMAAARIHDRPAAIPSGRSIAWLSTLSMLPDADVIGLALGVAYEDPLGHRGATHSFVFAAAVAGLAGRSSARAEGEGGVRRSLPASSSRLILCSIR